MLYYSNLAGVKASVKKIYTHTMETIKGSKRQPRNEVTAVFAMQLPSNILGKTKLTRKPARKCQMVPYKTPFVKMFFHFFARINKVHRYICKSLYFAEKNWFFYTLPNNSIKTILRVLTTFYLVGMRGLKKWKNYFDLIKCPILLWQGIG